MERLLTTPLEVLQRKEFLDDVNTNTDKVMLVIDSMHKDLEEVAADAEQKVCIILAFLFHLLAHHCLTTEAEGPILRALGFTLFTDPPSFPPLHSFPPPLFTYLPFLSFPIPLPLPPLRSRPLKYS